MQQSIVKFYCFVVQTLLNMFRATKRPSSGARQTVVAASGFRITNRPRLRTLPPPHSYGNQRLQRQFDGAPDDGHNKTRNMLGTVCTTKQ